MEKQAFTIDALLSQDNPTKKGRNWSVRPKTFVSPGSVVVSSSVSSQDSRSPDSPLCHSTQAERIPSNTPQGVPDGAPKVAARVPVRSPTPSKHRREAIVRCRGAASVFDKNYFVTRYPALSPISSASPGMGAMGVFPTGGGVAGLTGLSGLIHTNPLYPYIPAQTESNVPFITGSAFHSPRHIQGSAFSLSHGQNVQLEWLARNGLLSPSALDYSGKFFVRIILFVQPQFRQDALAILRKWRKAITIRSYNHLCINN